MFVSFQLFMYKNLSTFIIFKTIYFLQNKIQNTKPKIKIETDKIHKYLQKKITFYKLKYYKS